MVAFYFGWRAFGLLVGIAVSTAVSLGALSHSSVEAFLAVNLVTGVPLAALLLGWSVWYAVRFFRRSEEWGEAIRVLDELAVSAAVSPADPLHPRHPPHRAHLGV